MMDANDYRCLNCNEPIYHRFYRRERGFCSHVCKQEYHYLRVQMSASQMAILELLILQNGGARIPIGRTSDSLHFKVMPLIELKETIGTEVYAKITETGIMWFNYHRGWYEAWHRRKL